LGDLLFSLENIWGVFREKRRAYSPRAESGQGAAAGSLPAVLFDLTGGWLFFLADNQNLCYLASIA
jgi:hypothetical protein